RPRWFSYHSGKTRVRFHTAARSGAFRWTLSLGRGDQPSTFHEILHGRGNTHGTVTDNVHTRGLRDGLYTLRLRVVDHRGHVGEDRQAFFLRRDHSLLP